MAYENFTRPVTMTAGQDLSGYQYRFVSIATDGQVDPTGLGLESEGVLQDTPSAAGRAASVVSVQGDITKLEVGGPLPVSRDVMSDTVGRGIIATSGGRVLAVALESATAAGQVIAAMLKTGSSALQVTTTTSSTTTSTTSTTSTTTTTTAPP